MQFAHTCRQCGTEFITSARHSIHCSRACAGKSRSNRVERTCTYCQKPFSRPASHIKRNPVLWCSDKCRYATPDWQKALHASNPPVTISCQTCSKTFTAHPSEVGRKKFCSKKCLGLHNGQRIQIQRSKPKIAKTCDECGNTMMVKMNLVNRKRFCSRACNARWHCRRRRVVSPTGIEIALQSALSSLGIAFEAEFALGKFNIDIAIPSKKIAVEADGTYWHSLAKQKIADARKNAFLRSQGWIVMRFTEIEINNDANLCAKQIETLVQT